jgi:hypothetical protein
MPGRRDGGPSPRIGWRPRRPEPIGQCRTNPSPGATSAPNEPKPARCRGPRMRGTKPKCKLCASRSNTVHHEGRGRALAAPNEPRPGSLRRRRTNPIWPGRHLRRTNPIFLRKGHPDRGLRRFGNTAGRVRCRGWASRQRYPGAEQSQNVSYVHLGSHPFSRRAAGGPSGRPTEVNPAPGADAPNEPKPGSRRRRTNPIRGLRALATARRGRSRRTGCNRRGASAGPCRRAPRHSRVARVAVQPGSRSDERSAVAVDDPLRLRHPGCLPTQATHRYR